MNMPTLSRVQESTLKRLKEQPHRYHSKYECNSNSSTLMALERMGLIVQHHTYKLYKVKP